VPVREQPLLEVSTGYQSTTRMSAMPAAQRLPTMLKWRDVTEDRDDGWVGSALW
jgi:hypothetical protein